MTAKAKKHSLSISCVTFNTAHETLDQALASLYIACNNSNLSTTSLYLIDNGPDRANLTRLENIKATYESKIDHIEIISGHGNVGYGRGNNLAIHKVNSDYHLIMNPDVILKEDTLGQLLNAINEDLQVALAAPYATDSMGTPQHLAKRKPTILTLALRFLNNNCLNKVFSKRLMAYQYQDKNTACESFDIEFASGCFMLCRTSALKEVKGFDPEYFMYFEDFDLSRRLRETWRIRHIGASNVIHEGGYAGKKGVKHIYYFLTSAAKFYKPQTLKL